MTAPLQASSDRTGGRMLHASRRKVTRFRRPIVIGLLCAAGFVGLTAVVIGFQPMRGPPKSSDPEVPAGGAAADRDFGGLASSYAGPDGGLAVPTPPANHDGPAESEKPPAPTPEQQQTLALAQTARSSAPFFGAVAAASGPQPSPSAIDAIDLQPAVGAAPAAASSRAADLPPSAVQNMQEAKRQFVASGSVAEDYVAATYRSPISPYEVKAGDIISAALVTAINSDLPGEIVAQVTRNVFDHQTGRHLLIPQGARLVGHYDSQIAYGQSRALIVWNRIVMPDGRSVNIGSMTGGDAQGASGLADRVDSHIGPITRAIALSTAITVGGVLAQDAAARSNGNLVLTDAAGGVSAQASQAGQRFIDRDLNRQPTIVIRAGWPVVVIASKDILLAPY